MKNVMIKTNLLPKYPTLFAISPANNGMMNNNNNSRRSIQKIALERSLFFTISFALFQKKTVG